MAATGEGPLTQMARAIQRDNQQFQQDLTGAALQAASAPQVALVRLDQSWAQCDELEQRELAFLAQMGGMGAQQTAAAKESWRENRLLILTGKAQVLLLLGRYDDSQTTIDKARILIPDPAHPAVMMLDQLEVAVIQGQS